MIADEILFGKLKNGGNIAVNYEGDKLTFEFSNMEEKVEALG